jgi:hypothetical protein
METKDHRWHAGKSIRIEVHSNEVAWFRLDLWAQPANPDAMALDSLKLARAKLHYDLLLEESSISLCSTFVESK